MPRKDPGIDLVMTAIVVVVVAVAISGLVVFLGGRMPLFSFPLVVGPGGGDGPVMAPPPQGPDGALGPEEEQEAGSQVAASDSASGEPDPTRLAASADTGTTPAALAWPADTAGLLRERLGREEPLALHAAPAGSGRIAGRVLDERNRPIIDATVRLDVLGHSDSVVTDVWGTFRFEGVAEGTAELQVSPPAGTEYLEPQPKTLELAEAQTRDDVTFILLPRGMYIEGYVFDRMGEPVAGATVVAQLRGGLDVDPVVTAVDERGHFRVEGVPPDGAIPSLTASHVDYESETRRNVTAWDGEQIFRLERINNLVLRVVWAYDDSPVTFFAYRLLKKGFNDFEIDVGKSQVIVEDLQGRAVLQDVENGTWRVEVIVLGEGNALTDIRGSTDFTLERGGEHREIPVRIDMGRLLAGYVTHPDGSPASGVDVEIVPPQLGAAADETRYRQLQFPSTTTDETGTFVYEGMPPGRYTLMFQKDTLRAGPFDIPVVVERDPPPLEVTLSPGGVIFGQVIGRDGEPLANVAVERAQIPVNESRWVHTQTRTDSEGMYRFEGLRPGMQYLFAMPPNAPAESRSFELRDGEEKRVDFDFTGMVIVTGTVYAGEEPARGGGLNFIDQDLQASGWIPIDPQGRYMAELKPGTYWARVSVNTEGGSGSGEVQDPIVVAEQPAQQTHDLRTATAHADVVLVFPDAGAFERGRVLLEPVDRKQRYGFQVLDMTQENRRVPNLIAGDYVATYHSRNGQWYGDSGVVTVESGGENLFVIEAKQLLRGARVGGWQAGEVSVDGTRLNFDVTGVIRSGGSIEVIVMYERGRYAVQTHEAVLLANGRPVSRDAHLGWSGFEKWGNVYRLHLDDFRSADVYTLQVQLNTDGGTDSEGSVYLNMN